MGEEAQASSRGQHIFSIGLSLTASLLSGAIFLVSIIDQLALVEIAASLCTALQVFFFFSAIADLIERGKTSRGRNSWVVVFALLLIAFYSLARYLPGALDGRVASPLFEGARRPGPDGTYISRVTKRLNFNTSQAKQRYRSRDGFRPGSCLAGSPGGLEKMEIAADLPDGSCSGS